jgi:hypothetical protein
VLVLLAIIFVWQAWRMWFNFSLVLAPFDFLEAGKPSAESGEQFARMVRADLVQLAGLYNAGEVANVDAVPSSNQGEPVVPMEIPAEFDTSFFENIELKAYGIEFGTIFKSLRRQLESPSEITGSVTHQGATYSVFAELKQPGAGAESLQRWSIQYAKDLPDATRNLACRIFRSLAANPQHKTPDGALFRAVDDEDFCLFNHALAAYDQYRLRRAILSDADGAKVLAEANGPLANLLGHEVVTFPYVHKLAALVFYEQKKYIEAESAIERYMAWLEKTTRKDKAAETLRTNIKSKKLQTTPAVSRLRPVQPGSSVGSLEDKGAGMICCVVKDAGGRRYLLSAAHVFGSTGDSKIVQPAVRDGGTEADVVADRETVTSTMAIARMREKVETDPRVLELGSIMGFASKPADGQVVVTYGFDGKRREGKVVSTGLSLEIRINSDAGKSVSVENATVTSDISSGGEIGAPVLTPEGKLVGMIFATGGGTTVVLPVEPVLKKLGLELVK